jgi:hypothetical protein
MICSPTVSRHGHGRPRPEPLHRRLVDRSRRRNVVEPGEDDARSTYDLLEAPRQVGSCPGPRSSILPRYSPRVCHDQVVARTLKQRAPVEVQRLDDAAQAVLDRLVHLLRLEIDEARRQIAEERLEAQALRDVGRDVTFVLRFRLGARGTGRHASLHRWHRDSQQTVHY